MRACTLSLVVLVLVSLVPLAGCNTVTGEKFQATQRQLQAVTEQVVRLENQLATEQQATRIMQEELAKAHGVNDDVLAEMVLPVKIELEGQSGPYDTDGRSGDDGVVVYVQPIDKDGHVVKSAGRLSVTLLDLADPQKPTVIAPYEFDVATTRSLWYGRMWTHHFTARCPWPPSGLPSTNEITVRVVFTELLTGRTMSTQQTYQITRAAKLTTTPAN